MFTQVVPFFLVSLFIRRCLPPISNQRLSGFRLFWALLSSTSNHPRHPPVNGYIEQDIRALFLAPPPPFPLSHHSIDTPPIAGLVVGGGIHTPPPDDARSSRDVCDQEDCPSRPFTCISYHLGSASSRSICVITSDSRACFRISIASHSRLSPPPPSALPGRPSY